MPRSKEIQLGQLLVQKRRCALQQVNKGLATQRRLRAENRHRPLGRILVENGSISEEDLKDALFEMGGLQVYCRDCDIQFQPTKRTFGAPDLCPQCSSPAVFERGGPLPTGTLTRSHGTNTTLARSPASSASPGSVRRDVGSGSAGMIASRPETCVGKILGGCELVSKVAHGGMGVVYKATQLNLGRTVAVKILSEELARDGSFVRRFMQEARAAAQLNHGNVVHINDVGEYQGIYFYVMEFVDGENLREILQRERRLEVRVALEITVQVCHALRHAHSRGVIHRDIKPENIMITNEGGVKLADLGLAKRLDAEHKAGITHAGSILGTPYYMAPEQAKDFSKVDCRSDIYSLGVTVYRMISGKVPFRGRSPIEVMIKALDGKKSPIRELREGVGEDVEVLVDQMMHRDPTERFQRIDDALVAINQVLVTLPMAEPTV
jgi:predicted Ser/Thr protein kinase